MQINGIQNNVDAALVYGIRSSREAAEDQRENVNEEAKSLYGKDEYIPSENDEPIGLYRVSEDEDGNPKIDFDQKPEPSSQKADDGKSPEKAENKPSPKDKSESCTCNTDKVDSELRRLREKREQLEQKLRTAEGENAERLEKQLKSIESELALKDNDNYRRQQAEFNSPVSSN